MIEPAQKDDLFLEDVRRGREEPEALHVWWLGQSGFLAQWNGLHLLFDPYLSDSLTRKYAGTDKPHVRMTARVVAPEKLDFIDVVTSSHTHTDHLDAETLQPLIRANPNVTLVFPEANGSTVIERLGGLTCALAGVDAGETVSMKRPLSPHRQLRGERENGLVLTPPGLGATSGAEVEISGITAAHNEVERDAAGHSRFLGFVARMGPWTLYHSGDTVLHGGLVPELAPFSIDVAFLPINGNKPERRVAGNLNGREAAELARAIGARLVAPCHYEMFTFNTESPELFEETCRQIGQPFRTLRAGERLSLTK